MFTHFNWWFISIPFCALVIFAMGWRQHYAEACRVRSNTKMKGWVLIIYWVAATLFNIILTVCESWRGFLQLALSCLNPVEDAVEWAGIVMIGGIIIYTALLAAIFFGALVLGENLSLRHARSKARARQVNCQLYRRSVVCQGCPFTVHDYCPARIDRTPNSYKLDPADVLVALEAAGISVDGYHPETWPTDNNTLQVSVTPIFLDVAPERHRGLGTKPAVHTVDQIVTSVAGLMAMVAKQKTQEQVSNGHNVVQN